MQNIVGQLLDISIFYHKMKKIWEKNFYDSKVAQNVEYFLGYVGVDIPKLY